MPSALDRPTATKINKPSQYITTRTCTVALESVSPVSFSKFVNKDLMTPGETHDEFEERLWRERCHYDKDRKLFIPGIMFQRSVVNAAKLQGEKIVGKGSKQWGKIFESGGVLVVDNLSLPIKVDDVQHEWLMLHGNPSQKGGSRVPKCMPVIHEWKGEIMFYVLNDMIDTDTFQKYVTIAGMLIGIGRFSPLHGGIYGRYQPVEFRWN